MEPQFSKDLLRVFNNMGSQKSLEDLLILARFTLKNRKARKNDDNVVFVYCPDMLRLLKSTKTVVLAEGKEIGTNYYIRVRYDGIVFIHTCNEHWWVNFIYQR